MYKRLESLIEEALGPRESEHEGKVVDLSEAVRQHIRPGMSISFVTTHYRPAATINEILRQFHGTKPGFTLIGRSLRDEVINLIHAGLVEKAIVGWYGTLYPTPAPNPVIEKACREGRLEIEDWTFLTMIQRLMAGAMGLGFMPTNSIQESGIQEDNKDSFRIIENPFNAGEKIGVLRPLNPDISIVHGWAADKGGNTIILPPFFEDTWGPMASKNGAVVTVERVVSTQFIRDHSALVRLPGYMVKSVSEVPFGAHPGGMSNHGLDEFEAYGEDYEYLDDYRRACSSGNPSQLDEWIQDWILDTDSHDDYLRKLGYERLLFLKAKMGKDVWRQQLKSIPEDVFLKSEYSPTENMICASARRIAERVTAGGYKTMLAGSGVNFLISSLAWSLLRKEGYDIDLIAELGHYGYLPVPLDPTVFSLPTISTCKMAAGGLESLGIWAGGENNKCLAVIGIGQIDKQGNINTTRIPEKDLLLTGSGGGNDVASRAQEVLVVAYQSKNRFVDEVPYITSPGKRVRTLVSDLGVFEKIGDDDEFTLTGYFANRNGEDSQGSIANIRQNCGWEIRLSPQIQEIQSPSAEELMLVRLLDPHYQFNRT